MNNTISQTYQFGYWFYPPESHQAPGGNRLDIVLRDTQNDQNFATKNVHVSVKSEENRIEILTIHHPWLLESSFQLCAGAIEIISQRGEKVEAYTLGGNIFLDSEETSTTCILKSPAPIIRFDIAVLVHKIFVEEMEILLAERKAVRLPENHHTFDNRLANIEPFLLYLVILKALTDKFDKAHRKEEPQTMDFINFLHGELRRLQNEGLIPFYLPSLEEVL